MKKKTQWILVERCFGKRGFGRPRIIWRADILKYV
jgi:hypothetical protein